MVPLGWACKSYLNRDIVVLPFSITWPVALRDNAADTLVTNLSKAQQLTINMRLLTATDKYNTLPPFPPHIRV